MKSFITLMILLSASWMSTPLMGQNNALQPVVKALQAGSASALARHFDSNVEVTLLDQEDIYSKAQSEQIVKDFFMKHNITGFSLMHEGSSGDSAVFGIGILETNKGKFRTYIYLKESSGKYVIQKLKFTHD